MKATGIPITKGFLTLPIFSHTIDTDIPTILLSKIINYLKNGHLVMGFMGATYDDKGRGMVYDSFLTDGQWVWPDCYTYFTENNIFRKIEKDFLDYIISQEFKVPSISDSDLAHIKKEAHDNFENVLRIRVDCDETELKLQRKLIRGF